MAESGKSQFVPKGMRVTAERLAAFTRNRFRIENAGSNSALPGQIITVTLPSNTLVDLHSLKMHGTFTARGGGVKAATVGTPSTVHTGGTGLKHDKGFDNANKNTFSVKPAPPDDMHQLISRMTVSANGTAIQQGCIEYNTVHKLKSVLDRPLAQRNTVDNSIGFANNHPHPATSEADLLDTSTPQTTRAGTHFTDTAANYGFDTGTLAVWFPLAGGAPRTDDHTVTTLTDDTNFSADTYMSKYASRKVGNLDKIKDTLTAGEALCGLDSRDFTFYDWRGFCKESSVRYLPTDLVGALQVQITLAGPEVLTWFGRGVHGMMREGDYEAIHGSNKLDKYQLDSLVKAASYQIDDIYWTVDTISVDQAYGDMLRGKIAQFGYISLLFKEYYTFFDSSWTGKQRQHRFSLAAGSMDKIYTVLRDANYNKQTTQAITHRGQNDESYTPMFRFVCPSLTNVHNYGLPYIPDAVNIVQQMPPRPNWHYERDTDMTFDYKINSVMHPQYECHERDAIWDCSYGQDNVNGPNAGNQLESRGKWFEDKAIFPLNLNLTDGPLQLMSGYDSRGHSSFVEFNIRGLTHNAAATGGNYIYTYGSEKNCSVFPNGLSTTTVVETTSELRIGAGLSLAVAR